MGTEDVRSLARGLRSGDPAATAAVRARVEKILAFRGFGIPSEDRCDLEQTIMLQLWQAVRGPEFEPEKLWGFVEIVTSRRCIDWLRSRSPAAYEISDTIPDHRENPSDAAVRRQRQAMVRDAIRALPEPCRRLIELRIAQARPYEEISAIVGKSEGALRVQMTRCIKRAAEILRAPEKDSRS